MKYLATLVVALAFPVAAFAQTSYSPQYISELQQLLTLLKQELAALEAQPANPVSIAYGDTGSNDVAAIQTAPVSESATVQNGVVTFDITFNVTSATTTIDIPQNAIGIPYQINGIILSNPLETITCPSAVVHYSQSYCEVPPATTQQFEVKVTAPTNGIEGPGQMSILNIKYYTDIQAGVYSNYQPVNTTTNYVSVNQ